MTRTMKIMVCVLCLAAFTLSAQSPPPAAGAPQVSRAAVIAGRVLDERGQPISNAPIVVLQVRTIAGERTFWSLGSRWPKTNALGEYRAYNLPAGTYVVAAFKPGDYIWHLGADEGVVYLSGSGSAGSNLTLGPRAPTPAEIASAIQQLQPSGRPALSPSPDRPVTPSPDQRPAEYGLSYYPGTADVDAAVPITVARGEERSGVDFSMVAQVKMTIAGQIVMPDGGPAEGVSLSFSDGNSAGTSRSSGRFERSATGPARYTLLARMDGATSRLWAKRDVFVHGEDISNVTLTLQPCLTLGGRIVFESAATTVASPSSSAIRLRLRDARKTPLTSVDLPIMPNGTFTTASVVPGRYQIALVAPRPVSQAAGGAGTWSIRSVTRKGQDVTDLTFTIAETDNIDDVVVTLTDGTTELAGTLIDAAGAPVAGYRIVAFSTNPGHWYQGGRRLPAPVQSAADGTYRFTGLPAGTYHIAALREVDPQELFDDALLSALARSAVTVTLQNGGKTVQSLRVAGGD